MTVGSGAGQVKINQVEVLDQFSPQGSGGTSCGYQALKNVVGITALAKGLNWSHWLSDPKLAASLFAMQS